MPIKSKKLKVRSSDYKKAAERLKLKGQQTDRKRKCALEAGVIPVMGTLPR